MSAHNPYLGWTLRFHPAALNESFWSHSTEQLLVSDRQVASYFLLAVVLMTVPHLSVAGSSSPAAGLVLAWTLALAWVVLLQLPALYCRHRVAILSVLRLLLAWVGSQSSSCMHSQLLSPKQAQNSPVLAMLVQLLLVTNTVHIPMLAVRLPMPMLLQLLLTAVQPALLFMGGITRDLVSCTSTREAQSTLARLLAAWGAVVESGKFVPITDSHLLAGRSSAMLLAVCTMYATSVGVTLYFCYVSLWGQTLRWLRQHARPVYGEAVGADGRPPTVTIGGCVLERTRTLAICSTPGAMLLFNRSGVKGHLSRLCIHVSILNMVCLVCLLASQVLVQKLLPRLLPEHALDCCYPLVPASAA